MSTLVDFIDTLDETGKNCLQKVVSWIDLDQPGYIKHLEYEAEDEENDLNEIHHKIIEDRSYSIGIHDTIPLLMMLHKYNPSLYDKDRCVAALKVFGTQRNEKYLYFLDPKDTLDALREEAEHEVNLRRNRQYHYTVNLSELLLTTEDFDQIDFSHLNLSTFDFSELDSLAHLIPKEIILKRFKDDSGNLNHAFVRGRINCDLFDELFFGKDGWTEEQRIKWIKEYKPNEEEIADFMERIVAVDFKYMQYLDLIIQKDPAVAARLYKLKKPDDDLTGNETVAETFRYPKVIRKLFQLAAVCSRENIGKAMTGLLADMSTMIKFYGYNYPLIFQAMHPEYFSNDEDDSEENADALTA